MSSTFFKLYLVLAALAAESVMASGPMIAPSKSGSQASVPDEVQRRKAELRATLQAQNPPPNSPAPGDAASAPVGRMLSDRERADLRQQIRQQRP